MSHAIEHTGVPDNIGLSERALSVTAPQNKGLLFTLYTKNVLCCLNSLFNYIILFNTQLSIHLNLLLFFFDKFCKHSFKGDDNHFPTFVKSLYGLFSCYKQCTVLTMVCTRTETCNTEIASCVVPDDVLNKYIHLKYIVTKYIDISPVQIFCFLPRNHVGCRPNCGTPFKCNGQMPV